MNPETLVQIDWFFKLLVTVAVGIIGYFLNRTLTRIEGKLDVYAAIQAEHDKALGVFENRLSHIENDVRELRESLKECRRECGEGILK